MSYCRFMSGDVYMYPTTSGGIECCGCRLAEAMGEDWPNFDSRLDAHNHLLEHRKAGDTVPQYAFDLLILEIAELGDEV